MNIVVLAGGLSTERNVSLSSGSLICRALRKNGHDAVLVDLFLGLEDYKGGLKDVFQEPDGLCGDFAVEKTAPDLERVRRSRREQGNGIFGKGVLEVCAMADLVFIALHGECGEDGRVQAAFDLLEIPYTGSGYLGSAVAMNKDMTKRLIRATDVMTPAWFSRSYTEKEADEIAAAAEPPCVVKTQNGGSSIGVSIAMTREEVRGALIASLKLGGDVIVEQYIKGREFTVGVLENGAMPVIEIRPRQGFYNYENKYQAGYTEEICPAEIPDGLRDRLQRDALTVHRALGLSVYSRSDFIVSEEGTPYFLEVNTLPGMTPTSLVPQMARAMGISYEQLCQRIVDASLKLRRS